MTALEKKLKKIIRDHPDTSVHPHSPSGPYVRAVMWTATADSKILGQAFWDPEGAGGRWVVRAVDLRVGESSLVVDHPASMTTLPRSISTVLARVREGRPDRQP